jgi:methylmalonyl-CoA mutase C-terminal domain/subunit
MVYGRLLVSGDSTLAELQEITQRAMGWENSHLWRFRIYAREYRHDCGWGISRETYEITEGDLELRPKQKSDAGMEVIYTGLRRTPDQIVRAAVEEDVDCVGISILSGAHNTLLPRICQLLRLREADAADILVVAGGVIPQEDIPELEAAGVAGVFLSGTPIQEISSFIEAKVAERRKNEVSS